MPPADVAVSRPSLKTVLVAAEDVCMGLGYRGRGKEQNDYRHYRAVGGFHKRKPVSSPKRPTFPGAQPSQPDMSASQRSY